MDAADPELVERLTGSPLFPFEGDFTVKPLRSPLSEELPRAGEAGKPCPSCARTDGILWQNGRWRLTAIEPSANPVGLFLETNEHIDFEHFDRIAAEELGLMTWHLEAAIRSIDSVGRVHVHRWGDGSSHFHMWFQGRPARRLELYGWGNVLWPQILPPLPAAEIEANHRLVIDRLEARIGD